MSTLLRYVLRRVAQSVPILFGVVTIVFFLSRLMPGDVTDAFISPTVPQSVREELRSQRGLDRSIIEQYLQWLKDVASGNLGDSFTRNEPVLRVIGSVLPNTLILGSAAFFLEVIFGIFLALTIFLFHGKRIEKLLSHVLLGVYAIPPFWIGMLLLLVFSYSLGLFPSSQMYSLEEYGSFGSLLQHLVLPAFTVAIPGAAGFARYLRANIITVVQQDYVLFAQSMGLSRGRIFRSYVLPNALPPMISLAGVELGVLMTGALVTETLFSWPGMGQLTVHAIFSRDYPLLSGCVLIAGSIVVVGNLLADLMNMFFDPRIRTSEHVA